VVDEVEMKYGGEMKYGWARGRGGWKRLRRGCRENEEE